MIVFFNGLQDHTNEEVHHGESDDNGEGVKVGHGAGGAAAVDRRAPVRPLGDLTPGGVKTWVRFAAVWLVHDAVHEAVPVLAGGEAEEREHRVLQQPEVPRVVRLEQDHAHNGEDVEEQQEDESDEGDRVEPLDQRLHNDAQLRQAFHQLQHPQQPKQPQHADQRTQVAAEHHGHIAAQNDEEIEPVPAVAEVPQRAPPAGHQLDHHLGGEDGQHDPVRGVHAGGVLDLGAQAHQHAGRQDHQHHEVLEAVVLVQRLAGGGRPQVPRRPRPRRRRRLLLERIIQHLGQPSLVDGSLCNLGIALLLLLREGLDAGGHAHGDRPDEQGEDHKGGDHREEKEVHRREKRSLLRICARVPKKRSDLRVDHLCSV
mmetsp:Transcript_7598/g.14211  ORF Transcript_7598/g.14211 Transcript_7598/m.14211 type:complete len:370 (-) Transcript_7598:854-1963(-)